jgi:DNA polymerase-1
MWDFYQLYWLPFGEMLCDMEQTGIYVRAKDYLPTLELAATKDQANDLQIFRDWAIQQCPAAVHMNIASAVQKQHFFFAPRLTERIFSTENVEGIIEEGKKKAKKKRDFALTGLGMPVDSLTKKKTPASSLV